MADTEWTVRKVMQPDPVVISPDTTVQKALSIMNEKRIGALLVLDGPSTLVGIFTERDLLRRVVDAVPGWRDYIVKDWMTKNPYTIEPDLNWDEAVGFMAKYRVRHLPVMENGQVVGLISSRSLMVTRNDYLNQKVNERTLELSTANAELLSREAETKRNMRAAGRLHRQLVLPKAPPSLDGLTWAIHYKSLDHLGGDYYDFAQPARDHVGMMIADGSGHSIPAALLAVMASVAFNDVADRFDSPSMVLTQVNRKLNGIAEERFVSAFYGVLDNNSKIFRYSTAGHPPPLRFVKQSNSVEALTGSGFLLGIVPDETYSEKKVTLSPGDKVCLYTDGLTEARNEIGEQFGEERLQNCILEHGSKPAKKILEAIVAEQKRFCGSEPLFDDLTIMVFEIADSEA